MPIGPGLDRNNQWVEKKDNVSRSFTLSPYTEPCDTQGTPAEDVRLDSTGTQVLPDILKEHVILFAIAAGCCMAETELAIAAE